MTHTDRDSNLLLSDETLAYIRRANAGEADANISVPALLSLIDEVKSHRAAALTSTAGTEGALCAAQEFLTTLCHWFEQRKAGLVTTNTEETMFNVASHHLTVLEGIEERAALTRPSVAGFDLIAHLTRQREFSLKTFGPGARTKGVVDHIRKELAEIEADPSDISEWVDVTLLALDGAWRAGWTPEAIAKAIDAKQTKNEGRVWPDWRTASPDKAIEHDRSHDAPKPPVEG